MFPEVENESITWPLTHCAYSLWEKVFGNTWSQHICGDWVCEYFASRSSLGKCSHSRFGVWIIIALIRTLVKFWEQRWRSGLLATHGSCVCNFCRNCEWMAHRMWTGIFYVLKFAGDVLQWVFFNLLKFYASNESQREIMHQRTSRLPRDPISKSKKLKFWLETPIYSCLKLL